MPGQSAESCPAFRVSIDPRPDPPTTGFPSLGRADFSHLLTSPSNAIHSLSLPEGIWTDHTDLCLGTPPCPRHSHCAATEGAAMYVYGGTDARARWLGDIHMLHLDTLMWRAVDTVWLPRLNAPLGTVGLGCLFVLDAEGFDVSPRGEWQLHQLNLKHQHCRCAPEQSFAYQRGGSSLWTHMP